MVYVSPIIIPLILFEKTKNIFSGWIKQIISFSLQPMILFAYLAIFVSLMDRTLIGSATFYGAPPFRAVSCQEFCQDTLGNIVDNPNCDQIGQKLVVPKADSMACMISGKAFGNWPGLELIGVTLPFIIDFFTNHVRERILTVAKAALVLYFLLTFMDEIPEITSQLLGGASLPQSKISSVAMFKGIAGVMNEVQKRALRGIKKGVSNSAAGTRDAVRKILEAGNKGKSVNPSSGGGGSDKASSSKGSGGGDSAGGSSSGGSDAGNNSSKGADNT